MPSLGYEEVPFVPSVMCPGHRLPSAVYSGCLRSGLPTVGQEVSDEVALWRLRWWEWLEQVVRRLESEYPDDYSRAGDAQGGVSWSGFAPGFRPGRRQGS